MIYVGGGAQCKCGVRLRLAEFDLLAPWAEGWRGLISGDQSGMVFTPWRAEETPEEQLATPRDGGASRGAIHRG